MLSIIFLLACLVVSNAFSPRLNSRTASVLKKQSVLRSSSVAVESEKKANPVATATLGISTVNLVKNCVGSGIFSLNSRVAAISTAPAVLLPTTALVVGMAIWATYNFVMIGETCKLTKSSTYGEAWRRTVSEKSEWIIQAVVLIAPIVTCLASTIVLTDILSMSMRGIGAPLSLYGNRNLVIALLGSIILYPLCILQDLSAFKAVSAVGLLGHFSAMAVFAIRILDKSYVLGGKYNPIIAKTIIKTAAKPAATAAATAAVVTPVASKWFIVASILSYCFQAHYNAPRYYYELKDKDKDPLKFTKLTAISYLFISTITMGTVSLALKLFGSNSQSFALNSFNANDPLAFIARLAFGTSVLASFPLVFLAMRDWFVKRMIPFIPNNTREKVAGLLLLFICGLATVVKDLGIVASISGGVLGTSMMFVFPPIMYMRALIKKSKETGAKLDTKTILLNTLLLICGTGLGLFGTISNLLALKK